MMIRNEMIKNIVNQHENPVLYGKNEKTFKEFYKVLDSKEGVSKDDLIDLSMEKLSDKELTEWYNKFTNM